MTMRSPLVWLGGKGMFTNTLLPLLPAHSRYIEVFGGGASLLFAKPQTAFEVYNDVDPALADFFRVVQDPDIFPAFYRQILLTLHSRQLYNEYRADWEDTDDRANRVAKWLMVTRQSFAGRFGGSWAFSVKEASMAIKFMNAIRRLPLVADRLTDVKIENQSWDTLIDRYDEPGTFFYCDPPYVASTRRSGEYSYEMTDDDHQRLVDRLRTMKADCLLSGYDNEIYKDLDWYKESYETVCHGVGRTRASGLQGLTKIKELQTRTECVWLNYSSQLEMF